MTPDMPIMSSPFFGGTAVAPRRFSGAVPIVLDPIRIAALDDAGMEKELSRILVKIRPRKPKGELDAPHPDGTARVDSMTAVCLLAMVGGAFGQPRLVNLGRVDREALRSVGGVARLIRTALTSLAVTGAA